jgi:hypothetical protein
LPFFLRVLATAEADSSLTRTAYTLSPTVVKRWLEIGGARLDPQGDSEMLIDHVPWKLRSCPNASFGGTYAAKGRCVGMGTMS